METALIAMFIILAIESIALTFLYVKFHQEKRITSLRIERNNENIVERINHFIKQKTEKEHQIDGIWKEIFKKEWNNPNTQDLLTRIKALEKYLDVSYCSESDGYIVNWFHESNENKISFYVKEEKGYRLLTDQELKSIINTKYDNIKKE